MEITPYFPKAWKPFSCEVNTGTAAALLFRRFRISRRLRVAGCDGQWWRRQGGGGSGAGILHNITERAFCCCPRDLASSYLGQGVFDWLISHDVTQGVFDWLIFHDVTQDPMRCINVPRTCMPVKTHPEPYPCENRHTAPLAPDGQTHNVRSAVLLPLDCPDLSKVRYHMWSLPTPPTCAAPMCPSTLPQGSQAVRLRETSACDSARASDRRRERGPFDSPPKNACTPGGCNPTSGGTAE